MIWILFMFVHGDSITTQEFYTEAACKQAAAIVVGLKRHSDAICLPKGVKP